MNTKKLRYSFYIMLILFFAFNQSNSIAQEEKYLDNSFLTGAKKNEIDTLNVKTSKEIADETAGLLEKEIDPSKYIMGPNDILFVSIVTTKPVEYKVVVSPEGKILIPTVGVVDVKTKTLKETEKLIKQAVGKAYRNFEVYVVLKKLRKFKVIVSGAVRKPAIVPATAADRASEIIERAGGLKYDASIRNIILLRDEGKQVIPVDLLKFNIGEKDANPFVLGGDQIIVPPSSKEHSIQIWGEVAQEGIFEFVLGDSLSTLIKFAHGFLNSSFLDSVEIARFEENNASVNRWFVNISSWRELFYKSNNLPGDFPLKSGDRIYIRQKPNWQNTRFVVVEGEVNLPGKFAINKADTRVRDILIRAGNPTDEASLEGATLQRRKGIEKVDKEMKRLETILPSEMSENERRYYQARSTEQKGVMAINFLKVWDNPKSADNIILIDKDSIYVPTKKNFINVQGRVNNPGLVIFKKGNSYLDYIKQAGGFGFRAEKDETLIVKKKGEQFLASDMNYTLEPGDNILVPPEIETRINWWLWTTQVITMLAMLVAVYSTINFKK